MTKNNIVVILFSQISLCFISSLLFPFFSHAAEQIIVTKTFAELIISNLPGILTGLAGLLTAIVALLQNRRKLYKDALPDEIEKTISAKSFKERMRLEVLDTGTMDMLIRNGELVTLNKLDSRIVLRLESLNEMLVKQSQQFGLLSKEIENMRENAMKNILSSEKSCSKDMANLKTYVDNSINNNKELICKDITHLKEKIEGR
ncbi:MAG: hypothetical protein WAW37_03210 [Syntrophobacteraceae bacterium]